MWPQARGQKLGAKLEPKEGNELFIAFFAIFTVAARIRKTTYACIISNFKFRHVTTNCFDNAHNFMANT